MRRERDHHLPPRMQRKGQVYYYKAGNKWTRLSAQWDEAYRLYLELDGPPAAARTIGDAIRHYVAAVLPGKRPATQREYLRYARQLQAVFGEVRLDALDSSHVAQYIDTRSARVEANREASMLSSVFNEAMRKGWAKTNPCRGVRRNTERQSDVVPTEAELAALRLAANAQWQCILDMVLATGARKEDLLGIRLSDWGDEGLAMTQSKTGSRLLFERTPELAELWQRCRALKRRVGSLYLFCGRGGQRYTSSGFDSIWQDVRARSKIRPEVTFHSLRAWAITEAERRGGMDYARRLAGHKSSTTTARYVRGREVVRVAPLARRAK